MLYFDLGHEQNTFYVGGSPFEVETIRLSFPLGQQNVIGGRSIAARPRLEEKGTSHVLWQDSRSKLF